MQNGAWYTTANFVTCKRCGTTGLVWHKNALGKWYLVNTRGIRSDKPYTARWAMPNSPHDCKGAQREVTEEQARANAAMERVEDARTRLREAIANPSTTPDLRSAYESALADLDLLFSDARSTHQ